MAIKLGKFNSSGNQAGFTIVEVSVVIVLIATSIVTFIAGMSLYEKSKIKMQISQLKQYKAAYESFKIEYNAMPGDFDMASKRWESVPDGNGDGRINEDSATVDSINKDYEMVKFFQHLYMSEFIKENFYNSALLNIGFPTIKLNSSMGMLAYGSDVTGSYADFQISEKTAKNFHAGLGMNVSQAKLTGSDMFNNYVGTSSPAIYSIIDNKIDDGNSREGIFTAYRAKNSKHGDCLSGVDGGYLVTNEEPACMAIYIIDK